MWKHLEVELDYLVRRATFCGWQIAPRRISNYELVYVLRGQGDICLGNRQFTVRTGDLVCFCPGVLHSLSVARQPCMEFYGVHFTLPSDVDRLPLPEVAKIEPPGRLEPLFKSLFEIYKQKHLFINGGKMFCSSRSYVKYSPHCMGKMLPQSLSVLKKCWSISMRILPVRLRWKSLLPAPA